LESLSNYVKKLNQHHCGWQLQYGHLLENKLYGK
jgi:hypothetical protein